MQNYDWKPLIEANFLKNFKSAIRLFALIFYDMHLILAMITSHCVVEKPALERVVEIKPKAFILVNYHLSEISLFHKGLLITNCKIGSLYTCSLVGSKI